MRHRLTLCLRAAAVLVDVLSFERRDPHSSVWLAYGQFVRTFLLPLLAQKLLNWPLQASIFSRDGMSRERSMTRWVSGSG